MNPIFKRDKMYMTDGESFIVSEFDMMDESLNYTLDFNCKDGYSIFSNVYDTEHQKDTWSIIIDEKNDFYPALLEFLSTDPSIVYHDENSSRRFVAITLLEDMSISIKFNVPDNMFNCAIVRISEQDPNYERFVSLISSLSDTFDKPMTK